MLVYGLVVNISFFHQGCCIDTKETKCFQVVMTWDVDSTAGKIQFFLSHSTKYVLCLASSYSYAAASDKPKVVWIMFTPTFALHQKTQPSHFINKTSMWAQWGSQCRGRPKKAKKKKKGEMLWSKMLNLAQLEAQCNTTSSDNTLGWPIKYVQAHIAKLLCNMNC